MANTSKLPCPLEFIIYFAYSAPTTRATPYPLVGNTVLIDFFFTLKDAKIPVSIKEFLTLLEAMEKGLIDMSMDDFYFLSRLILVKDEAHYDKFDRAFGMYFKGIDMIFEKHPEIPLEWLSKRMERELSDEQRAAIEKFGYDKLMDRLKELLNEQKERHEGGNKWIGTGRTSPFGANGYNPAGYRIGQAGSRNRSAVKVWDKREFRDLSDKEELNTRNLKMALRRLRVFTRQGAEEELDLEGTIRETSNNAGFLKLKMVPERKNNIKVVMLFDNGGSMDDHVELCSRLFSAAKHEFKHLEFYYFHNCLYERVWKDNTRRWTDITPTFEMMNKFNDDYRLIFVGDASMSAWEILHPGGSVEHNNPEAGLTWMERITTKFPHHVWINPTPEESWRYSESTRILKDAVNDRMFPLTIECLDKAMKMLRTTSKRTTVKSD